MINGLYGIKLGMTRYYDESGRSVPVSVVEMGPCYVTQIKTVETDAYSAIQLGYAPCKEKSLNKPLINHLKKSNLPLLRHLNEIKYKPDPKEQITVGQEIKIDIFKEGEIVDVTGTSIGKGFQGMVKRYGFKGGAGSHGSMQHRRAGSIGGTTPQHVVKGRRMAGHMGHVRKTVQNLKVVKILADKNIMLIKGAIPGPDNGVILVRKAVKVKTLKGPKK